MLVHFFRISFERQLVCKLDIRKIPFSIVFDICIYLNLLQLNYTLFFLIDTYSKPLPSGIQNKTPQRSGDISLMILSIFYDDVIKGKRFSRNWPFVRGIHRSALNSPHKGQWRGALRFSLICTWINGWVNNREGGDLRRHRAHYDVIVMCQCLLKCRTRRVYHPLHSHGVLTDWPYYYNRAHIAVRIFDCWRGVLDTIDIFIVGWGGSKYIIPGGTRTNDPSVACRVHWPLYCENGALLPSWFGMLAMEALIFLFVKVTTWTSNRARTASHFAKVAEWLYCYEDENSLHLCKLERQFTTWWR